MQNAILAEVIPQVLAHGHHPLKLAPINHVAVSEPALRTIYPHRPARKRRGMPLSPAMDLIPLRHRLFSSPTKQRRRHWSIPRNTVASNLLLTTYYLLHFQI